MELLPLNTHDNKNPTEV